MEKTTNYKLFKPELGDRVSIGDINENMDILDEKLKDVETVKIDKSRILSTKEELEAVTEPGFLVDALVAAQLNSDKALYLSNSATKITLPADVAYTMEHNGLVILQGDPSADFGSCGWCYTTLSDFAYAAHGGRAVSGVCVVPVKKGTTFTPKYSKGTCFVIYDK